MKSINMENAVATTLTCPVCSHQASYYKKLDEVTLYSCAHCTHRFTDHETIRHQESYSEDYYEDKHANWFDNPNYRLFDYILSCIESLGMDNPSILDVGCGNGNLLRYLRGKSDKLSGFDYHENLPEEGIKFLRGDLFDLEFPQQYDVVVNLAVIEHVWDVQGYMQRLNQLCRDGGLVITMTVNDASLVYGIARLMHSFGLKAPMQRLYEKHHVNHFSDKSLTYLHQHSGFELVDNYMTQLPIQAVDMPKSNALIAAIYKSALIVLFALERLLGRPILQTITARKASSNE